MTATPTAQEVFDLAVAGVLKQGQRCLDKDGECVYRGPNGMKCAAGFVFTDEEVEGVDDFHSGPFGIDTDEEVEGVDDFHSGPFGMDTNAETVIKHRAPRLKPHLSLLEDLQHVHDGIPVEGWPCSFRAIATAHKLSPAVIDQWEAEQAGGDS